MSACCGRTCPSRGCRSTACRCPPRTRARTITFPSCTTAARTSARTVRRPWRRALPEFPSGRRSGFPDGDIDAANRLYGNAPPSITISSTPPGLQLLVDGEAVTAPWRLRLGARHAGRGGEHRAQPPLCRGIHRDGTLVSFRAVPAEGYVFANWAGPFIEHNLNLTNLPSNPVGFFVDGTSRGLRPGLRPRPHPGPRLRAIR